MLSQESCQQTSVSEVCCFAFWGIWHLCMECAAIYNSNKGGKRMKISKRVSALVVALIMLFSLFSISVSAWGTNEGIEV